MRNKQSAIQRPEAILPESVQLKPTRDGGSHELTILCFFHKKERQSNMKYGITYSYWGKDWEGSDYPQKIERARKCGLDILEIFYGRILTMSDQEIAEINAAQKDNGIEVYAASAQSRIFRRWMKRFAAVRLKRRRRCSRPSAA